MAWILRREKRKQLLIYTFGPSNGKKSKVNIYLLVQHKKVLLTLKACSLKYQKVKLQSMTQIQSNHPRSIHIILIPTESYQKLQRALSKLYCGSFVALVSCDHQQQKGSDYKKFDSRPLLYSMFCLCVGRIAVH